MKFELPFRLTHDRPSDAPPTRKETAQPATKKAAAAESGASQTRGKDAPAPVPSLEPPPHGPGESLNT